MKATGIPLETGLSPNGIVDFEFAWTVENAQAIMEAWELKHPSNGKSYAAYNMGLDALFLVVYSHAIGLGCLLVGKNLPSWEKVSKVFATLMIVAALFDVAENFGLIQLILGSEDEFYPRLSYYCAIPKFIFIIASLLFSIIGYVKYRFS